MRAGGFVARNRTVGRFIQRSFGSDDGDKYGGAVFSDSNEEITETIDFWGRPFTFKISSIGKFADAAIFAQYGDTAVLNTVVAERQNKGLEGKGFMPLSVEYREKRFAVGEIPGSWNKKEMFNTDHEVLTARKIDRSIRPMFQQGFFYDTQVISTVYAFDGLNKPDVVSINGASLALQVSDIPWAGPLAAVRLGRINGEYIVQPTLEEMKESDFDLLYVGNRNKTVMIEVEANEVPESEIGSAILHAHKMIQPLVRFQEDFRNRQGSEKWSRKLTVPRDRVLKRAMDFGGPVAKGAWKKERPRSKAARGQMQHQISNEIRRQLQRDFPDENPLELGIAATKVLEKSVRDLVLNDSVRVDNRGLGDLRELYGKQGIVPVVHGSGFFSRGDTQSLCTVTIGGVKDRKRVFNTIYGDHVQDFFLHYDFPPYSVKETGRVGGINRRMVGHGALAEKAMLPVIPKIKALPLHEARAIIAEIENSMKAKKETVHIETAKRTETRVVVTEEPNKGIFSRFVSWLFPSSEEPEEAVEGEKEEPKTVESNVAEEASEASGTDAYTPLDNAQFPYCLRVTSEVTASDGSSSMATVTGATVALLDAGIPLKRPVVGISMGLVTPDVQKNEYPYEIITDILGFEDYFTDMDYKCAGSSRGITAIQLDMKRQGIGPSILKEALEKSRDVRLEMLVRLEDSMKLKTKKENVQQRVLLEIDEEVRSAGEIIGRRGENLRKMEETVRMHLAQKNKGKSQPKRTQGERSWLASSSNNDECPVTFDVSRDGEYVEISSVSREAMFEGLKVIVDYCTPLETGKLYSGKVVKMLDDMGAVVEIGPGKDGFLHISQVTGGFLTGEDMNKYLWEGADVEVEVSSINDSTGRVKLKLHSSDGKVVSKMQEKSTGSSKSNKRELLNAARDLQADNSGVKRSGRRRRKRAGEAGQPKKGAASPAKRREGTEFRSQISRMVSELDASKQDKSSRGKPSKTMPPAVPNRGRKGKR